MVHRWIGIGGVTLLFQFFVVVGIGLIASANGFAPGVLTEGVSSIPGMYVFAPGMQIACVITTALALLGIGCIGYFLWKNWNIIS